MAVSIRAVAAITVVLFLLSFLSFLKVRHIRDVQCPAQVLRVLLSIVCVGCMLQVFHTGISAELNPKADLCANTAQELQSQLEKQKDNYAVLQRQLERLELSLGSTEGSPAATVVSEHHRSLPSNASPTHAGHKLAVLVPYREREQHLAKLVSRLNKYLTVSLR